MLPLQISRNNNDNDIDNDDDDALVVKKQTEGKIYVAHNYDQIQL